MLTYAPALDRPLYLSWHLRERGCMRFECGPGPLAGQIIWDLGWIPIDHVPIWENWIATRARDKNRAVPQTAKLMMGRRHPSLLKICKHASQCSLGLTAPYCNPANVAQKTVKFLAVTAASCPCSMYSDQNRAVLMRCILLVGSPSTCSSRPEAVQGCQ